MVTLTQDAEQAIRRLVAHAELPQVKGMRMSGSGDDGSEVSLTLVSGPEDGDRELEDARVPFYVEPRLAEALEGTALDAEVDTENGTVSFLMVKA